MFLLIPFLIRSIGRFFRRYRERRAKPTTSE